MRVTIDASSLLLRSAGVKSYSWHWLKALTQIAPGEIHAFPWIADPGRLDHEASVLGRWGTLARLGLLWSSNRFPGVLDQALRGSDIFHASNQVRRLPSRPKTTATLHDLTCWLMPELHTPANVHADREWAGHVLQRASGIIAVSESTRQDAIRVLNIPPERIHTIHSGVSDSYFDARPARRAKPYVLFVGTIEPRKNLDSLLDAWKQMRTSLREAFELVVAGPAGWAAKSTLARIRSEATYLGYVPEQDMPGLTAGATVFVYPSLYEGFGFPVAQAMAAGVAVVTSNVSSLPEIAGSGALFVDPRSPSEIASALSNLLENESLRLRLAAEGRAKAGEYRWNRCAEQSLAWFKAVLGRE